MCSLVNVLKGINISGTRVKDHKLYTLHSSFETPIRAMTAPVAVFPPSAKHEGGIAVPVQLYSLGRQSNEIGE